MSALKDVQVAERKRRAERVVAIREALGLDQWEFAVKANERAKALGVVARFHPSTLSRIETGNRPLTISEFVVVASLDKQGRGMDWLARGVQAKSEPAYQGDAPVMKPQRREPDSTRRKGKAS